MFGFGSVCDLIATYLLLQHICKIPTHLDSLLKKKKMPMKQYVLGKEYYV